MHPSGSTRQHCTGMCCCCCCHMRDGSTCRGACAVRLFGEIYGKGVVLCCAALRCIFLPFWRARIRQGRCSHFPAP